MFLEPSVVVALKGNYQELAKSSEIFTNSPQYKNDNIVICVLALSFEIYWTTKAYNPEMQLSYAQ